MPRTSAGLLVYRHPSAQELQVLLVHPGGPYWADRDLGAWSIPKGEFGPTEAPLATALREFAEEIGQPPPAGPYHPLGEVRQKGGKIVHAWACAGDVDVANIRSNTYRVEWPYRSGRYEQFPEVDRAEWFDLVSAREKINAAQVEFLDRLAEWLKR